MSLIEKAKDYMMSRRSFVKATAMLTAGAAASVVLPGCGLGRACIDTQYRNTSVFKLLFSGLGAYLKLYPHDYLIGLTTLPANAKNDIAVISNYLVENNAVNIAFGVKPKKQLNINCIDPGEFTVAEVNQREIIKKMSTLMLAYYKYGAEFISEPSMDVDFNPPVFDFFTIFDAHKFPSWV